MDVRRRILPIHDPGSNNGSAMPAAPPAAQPRGALIQTPRRGHHRLSRRQLISDVFDRRAAADYAMKWALMYNPYWPIDPASDCTNFISQALHAGGWTMIDNGRAPSDQCSWYCHAMAGSAGASPGQALSRLQTSCRCRRAAQSAGKRSSSLVTSFSSWTPTATPMTR
jgi:Putative amidase domain